jgi:bifunctional DNA-binding transcriptional regulator/antitoxin component of YhaV-PrlF toxin-antitoxin module
VAAYREWKCLGITRAQVEPWTRDKRRLTAKWPFSFAYRKAAMQNYCMSTTITMSPRGTLTLPIALRRKLRLNKNHSVLLVEERPDGIFLHPAVTVPIRDIPAATIKKWVTEDEAEAASVKIVKR